jgi:hypothetical protein
MLASTQEITGENKSYENTQFDVIKSKLQQVVQELEHEYMSNRSRHIYSIICHKNGVNCITFNPQKRVQIQHYFLQKVGNI